MMFMVFPLLGAQKIDTSRNNILDLEIMLFLHQTLLLRVSTPLHDVVNQGPCRCFRVESGAQTPYTA